MESVSRRTFIKRSATVAAVAGAAAVVPSAVASAATKHTGALAPIGTAGIDEPYTAIEEGIIAHITKSGEIQVFVGDREVTLHDRFVASRIIRATR